MAKKQDRRLHVRSLCILTAILESLVKFYQDHEDSEKTNTILEAGQAEAQLKKLSETVLLFNCRALWLKMIPALRK